MQRPATGGQMEQKQMGPHRVCLHTLGTSLRCGRINHELLFNVARSRAMA